MSISWINLIFQTTLSKLTLTVPLMETGILSKIGTIDMILSIQLWMDSQPMFGVPLLLFHIMARSLIN